MSGRHAAPWTLLARFRDRWATSSPAGRHRATRRPLVLEAVTAPRAASRHVNAAAS